MNDKNKIKVLLDEVNKSFYYINRLLEKLDFNLEDEYKKINRVYFKIFSIHYESFFILVKSNHFSSAIVLLRTILEIFVKSFYLELIEKIKGTSIDDILTEKKEFPTFFNMIKKLELHEDKSGEMFNGFFKQFLKSELSTYEQLSFFTHGKGEYIKNFYKNDRINFSSQQIFDVINLTHKFFISISIFHLFTFGYFDELKELINKYKEKID